jgi:hypothetical protein
VSIEQKPFKRYHLDKKDDTFTVKLNNEERLKLEEWKKLIQQDKDSTALKQLASIGAEVLLDEKMKKILSIVLNNYRKNKRLGVVQFDDF